MKIVFKGWDDIDKMIERFAKDAEDWIPNTAAAILSSIATRSFVEPALRISAWAPLSDAVMQASGRNGNKYKTRRTQYNVWRNRAEEYRRAAKNAKSNKARKSYMAKRKAAEEKAKKYRAQSIVERNKHAVVNRRPLIDTGRLWHSITYQDGIVTTDAPYASVHQWGGKGGTIPARPFVPITPDGKTTERVADEISNALRIRAEKYWKENGAK